MFKDVLSLTLLRFRVSQTTKAVTSVLVVDCGERRICLMCGRRAAAAARPTAAAAAEEPPDDGPLANDVVLRLFSAAAYASLSRFYISDPILLQDDDKALVDCNKVLLKE